MSCNSPKGNFFLEIEAKIWENTEGGVLTLKIETCCVLAYCTNFAFRF
jgi:hypothetical protein